MFDEHRAAGRVLADDRALRAPQDLDVGDVVIGLALEIAGEDRRTVAVSDHAGGGLRIVLGLADAANVEVVALAEIVDDDARRRELQGVDVGDALVGSSRCRKGRSRRSRVRIRFSLRRRAVMTISVGSLGCDAVLLDCG